MAKHSAGLLLYRVRQAAPEVFLVHPGGPFWAKKDAGAWSIPKGEAAPGEDLLTRARLDEEPERDRSNVDLAALAHDAVHDARARAPEREIGLSAPDGAVVWGDPLQLRQLYANLLGNARTHTAPGTVVRTYVVREPHSVKLMVRDNGPGVPTELQPNVFQRFARGDSSRNRAAGSTGLGLSIVAAVAEAHGGSVSLESEPGDTTFTVVLPA